MGEVDTSNGYRGGSGASSAVGHVREHNEDAYLCAPELGLWVVADGMGGHAAGEVASEIACRVVKESVCAGQDLQAAIAAIEPAIIAAIEDGKGSEGMGTTIVAARIVDHRYDIAWVGDSRAYLWHDRRLRQLTHDHSFVQELLDQHVITPEEADSHPEKSTLSRCLGGGNTTPVESDRVTGSFFANELLILCTDGVCGEVPSETIALELWDFSSDVADAQQVSESLVELALEHGGRDNATVIVIAAPPDAPERMRQTAPRKSIQSLPSEVTRWRSWKYWLIALIAVLVIASLVFGYITKSESDENGVPLDAMAGLADFSTELNCSAVWGPYAHAGHSIRG